MKDAQLKHKAVYLNSLTDLARLFFKDYSAEEYTSEEDKITHLKALGIIN